MKAAPMAFVLYGYMVAAAAVAGSNGNSPSAFAFAAASPSSSLSIGRLRGGDSSRLPKNTNSKNIVPGGAQRHSRYQPREEDKVRRKMVTNSRWLAASTSVAGGAAAAAAIDVRSKIPRGSSGRGREKNLEDDGGTTHRYRVIRYREADADVDVTPPPPTTTYEAEFTCKPGDEETSKRAASRALRNSRRKKTKLSKIVRGKLARLVSLEAALFLTYLCGSVAINTPVVLLPVIAADPSVNTALVQTAAAAAAAAASGGPMSVSGGATLASAAAGAASFAAAVTSIGTMGGAVGKFVNGFVCQSVGGRRSSSAYLTALAASALLFSTATSLRGIAAASMQMEFCNSIMWTACASVLAAHAGDDAARFAAGITALSLASTAGALTAKVGFSFLLRYVGWRTVARVAAAVALAGAGVVWAFVHDSRDARVDPQGGPLTVKGVGRSLGAVMGNRVFWAVGCAHAMAYMARSSDKVLGTFFKEVTNLPGNVCGGLTSSVTVGFVHGLITGKKFNTMTSARDKKRFLTSRYGTTVLSALALSLCASGAVASRLGPTGLAAAVALASGIMASSISFQFYQFPAAFAKTFGADRAVCLSFLDGMGFLFSAPIWAATGRIVATTRGGVNGWMVAWASLAVYFTLGGVLMMGAVPNFLEWKRDRADRSGWRRGVANAFGGAGK